MVGKITPRTLQTLTLENHTSRTFLPNTSSHIKFHAYQTSDNEQRGDTTNGLGRAASEEQQVSLDIIESLFVGGRRGDLSFIIHILPPLPSLPCHNSAVKFPSSISLIAQHSPVAGSGRQESKQLQTRPYQGPSASCLFFVTTDSTTIQSIMERSS